MNKIKRANTRPFASAITSLILSVVAFNSQLQAAEPNSPPPSPVRVEQVKPFVDSPVVKISGTVYSQNQVDLTAGVSGRLEWVIEPGSYIAKGDKVAQIELLPIKLRLAESKAQFNRAKINLQYLSKELNRQQELRQKNNTSQLQYEQTQSQVELAKADLEIAEIQLQQVNRELNKATILSPFEGVVTQRFRRAGFDVGPSEILVQLLDTRNLEVRVHVPIKYLAFTQPGSLVELSSQNSHADIQSLKAQTTSIIPAADRLSQTFEIRIKIPESGASIWSTGQLVDVQIPIESKQMNLAVHRDALLLRSDGTYIVKIDENNTARRLKVKVGKGKDQWVSVVGDLKEGDRVAIRGAERLAEGQSVVIQNAGT